MRRFNVAVCLLLPVMIAGCASEPDRPVSLPEMPALGEPVPLPDDPRRQFDFWLGEWSVQNKQLQDGAWQNSGRAVARVQPVVDGGAVLEQWNGTLQGKPLIGFSLRAYDPAAEQWRIYLNWHGGAPGGFSEMYGSRRGERLEQFPPDDAAQLRYSFSLAHENSCQWDRAAATDGKTWVTDWVMQFTRRAAPLSVDATNAPIVEPPQSASTFDRTRALDFLIGAWFGPARSHGPDRTIEEATARARVTSMIDGFGLLQFLDTSRGEKTLTAMGWDKETEGWVGVRAGSRSDGLVRLTGEPGDDRAVTFTGAASRESWSCPEPNACRFRRETTSDDGTSWQLVLEADLERSASTSAWLDIYKARAPFPDVLTGGQPTEEELARAALNGYRTVINLRSAGEEDEIVDQAGIVAELGMTYVSIPMSGSADVSVENARLLAQALDREGALPAIVHCRSGNRVGALFALKAFELDGRSAEQALEVGRRSGLTSLEPAIRERLGVPASGGD